MRLPCAPLCNTHPFEAGKYIEHFDFNLAIRQQSEDPKQFIPKSGSSGVSIYVFYKPNPNSALVTSSLSKPGVPGGIMESL